MSKKGLASNCERMPYRGGNWNNGGNAGLGALNLNNSRANANTNIGFRLRFRSKLSQKLYRQGGSSSVLIERIPVPRRRAKNNKQSARGTCKGKPVNCANFKDSHEDV